MWVKHVISKKQKNNASFINNNPEIDTIDKMYSVT